MRWILCTDGRPRDIPATQYLSQLVQPGKDQVILLGVGSQGKQSVLQSFLDGLQSLLKDVEIKQVIRSGDLAGVADGVAREENADFLVYASRGRGDLATRLLFGAKEIKLIRKKRCSVLVIREAPVPLRKIIICVSLSPETAETVTMGAHLAQSAGCEVILLHIMSQVALIDQALVAPLEMTAEEAIAQGTIEGQMLKQGLDILAKYGVKASANLRHGPVLDEVIAEVKEEKAGLLVIGAHSVISKIRWSDWLTEDLATDILLNTHCPVLITRHVPQK